MKVSNSVICSHIWAAIQIYRWNLDSEVQILNSYVICNINVFFKLVPYDSPDF